VAVSPAGQLLAVSAYASLALFDAKTYKQVGAVIDFGGPVSALAFSPDGALLATAEATRQRKGRVIVTEAANPKGPPRKVLRYGEPVSSLAFAPDGRSMVTASGIPPGFGARGPGEKIIRLRLWEQDRELREFAGHAAVVTQVAFSADGNRIFSASTLDGTLRVWNNDEREAGKEILLIPVGRKTATQGPRRIGRGDPTEITCTALWPRGRALVGYGDGSFTLWDFQSRREERFPSPSTEAKARVSALAFSPDGHHALTVLTDGLVYLYRLPPP
jgi:WD40 repeat protein